jgi:hypothetical protein
MCLIACDVDDVQYVATQSAGTLPPNWGTQGYYWNSTYNTTQALTIL